MLLKQFLNTILLGKLNKFSEQNYAEIKEFVTHIIDGGQTEMIKCFMKLVFEKAASEEMFCPLYAKLLSELSSCYPVLLTEMTNLYTVYMAIFEEVPETKAENYNEVCKQNIEKKYRRGYSQFLAELIKHSVINTDIFMKTIMIIITQVENNLKTKEATKVTEEYADCLMKIMKAIQEDVDEEDLKKDMITNIRQTLKGEPMAHIKPFTVRNPEWLGLSNKARFTFLDIYEGIQKF
jgi:signal recognition particle GTPase